MVKKTETLGKQQEALGKQQSGREKINEHLHEAIDGLRKDVTRVEIWATALSSFAQPVPDYSPSTKFDLGQDQSELKGDQRRPSWKPCSQPLFRSSGP
jgi:DNA-directed RNA polymerase sigma subunit (sigma70/sigma32)